MLALSITCCCLNAQIQIDNLDSELVIDFTGFAGEGFAPEATAGQLSSLAWSAEGFTEMPIAFGDSSEADEVTGLTDGSGVSAGGLYAFDDGNNQMLWVQPTGAVFTPGNITLKVCNNTGASVTGFDINYDIIVRNDGERGNSFNFSHSTDNENYINQPVLDYVSEEVPDSSVQTIEKELGSLITDLAAGDCLYLRWSGGDMAGTGTRDEFGLDNIGVRFQGEGGGGGPTVGLPPVQLSTPEGNLSQIFLNISEAADCEYAITVNADESTAEEDIDFELLTPTISFSAEGSTTEILKIQTLDDLLVEEDEVVALEMTSLTEGCAVGNATGTFVIENNDFESMDFAEVIAEDEDGVSTVLGEDVQLQGIVHGINLNSFGINFTLINGDNGIRVQNPTSTFGYIVNEGDEVIVSGTIAQDKGLTILQAVSVTSTSNGNDLQEISLVTELSEATESKMIKLENMTLVNPEVWNDPADASGFEVIMTNGSSTIPLFISKQSDIYGTAAPVGSFDVSGIGGQVDPTSPYLSGYRIEPRYLSDLVLDDPAPTVTIGFDLLNLSLTEDSGLIPLTINASPNNTGNDLSVNVQVSSSSTATIDEDFTLSETNFIIADGDSGNLQVDLEVIDDMLNEETETVVLELSIVNGNGGELTNASLEITIEDNDDNVSIEGTAALFLQAYPNPCLDEISITSSKEITAMEVVNLSGQVVIAANQIGFEQSLDMSALPSGIYLLSAIIDGNVVTEKIVKR